MKNIKKILLVSMFLIAGVPALITQFSGGDATKIDNAVFADKELGYYRLDLTCYYQCGEGLCTGSQCNVPGSGCNWFNSCSA
jgi:hypothetical protein